MNQVTDKVTDKVTDTLDIELFAGAGGLALGLEQAGIKSLGFGNTRNKYLIQLF